MRVALFSDTYRPRIGGVTISVLLTAEALRSVGAEVTLFVPSPHHGAHEKDTIFLPTVRVPVGGRMVRIAIPYGSSTVRQFCEKPFDVIHSFSAFWVGRYAITLARKTGVPAVFTYQTNYAHYGHFLPLGKHIVNNPAVRRYWDTIITAWTRRTCNAFNGVIVPTPTTASSLRGIGVQRKVDIIPVGFSDIAPKVDGDPRRGSLPKAIPDDAFVFLHVSRLSSEKNIPFLLRAFAKAANACSKAVHLLVVGDGVERSRLERLTGECGIAQNVQFIGEVPHDHVGAYYRAADAFLFSSYSDAQAFVVCEALMSGLPVIALRAPGPSDFVVDGQHGFLIDDEEGFVEAMICLAEDGALYRAIADRARKHGEQFTLQRYAQSLIALYQSLEMPL